MNALRKSAGQSDQVVYKGRNFAGAVSFRNRQWRALDADGRILGHFESRLAAVAAVLRVAQR
jgi:hypothetical protein